MKEKISLRIELSDEQRRRAALVSAGIAPSKFGERLSSRTHKDRKAALRRGDRKHKSPWA